MTSEQSIIINVDSEWLHKNFIVEENQVFVFDGNKSLRLITIFDNIGMTVKKWTPYAGSSVIINDKYSWTITKEFKEMVNVYKDFISRMNILLNYNDNTISLYSHGFEPHGFRWKISNADIDGETTWELADNTVATSCEFDWRDLNLVLRAASFCHTASVKVTSTSNDVIWEGYNEEGIKCWAHQNQRLSWKFGEASSHFQPDVLFRILQNMDKPESYGTNTKFSILKNEILMVESESTIGYLTPIYNEENQSEGGLNISTESVPDVN